MATLEHYLATRQGNIHEKEHHYVGVVHSRWYGDLMYMDTDEPMGERDLPELRKATKESRLMSVFVGGR